MTAPKLPEGLEPVAWLDDGLSASSGTEDSSFRVVTDKTKRGMPHSAVVAYTTPLVRLSDAQAALQALAAEKDAEISALKEDARRLDALEAILLKAGTVYLLPCGADLRFVQVRSVGEVTNYPTVLGLRAAIDSALALAAKEAK